MALTIVAPRSVLLPAFESFASFHSDTDDIAVFNLLLYKGSLLAMLVNASNNCIALCRISVTASEPDSETFKLPLKDIVPALKHMPDGDVTITLDGAATVSAGRRKTTFLAHTPTQPRADFMTRWQRYADIDADINEYTKFTTSGDAMRSFLSMTDSLVESPIVRWVVDKGVTLQATSSDDLVKSKASEEIAVEELSGPDGPYVCVYQLPLLQSLMTIIKKVAPEANYVVSIKAEWPLKISVGNTTTASRVMGIIAPFIEV